MIVSADSFPVVGASVEAALIGCAVAKTTQPITTSSQRVTLVKAWGNLMKQLKSGWYSAGRLGADEFSDFYTKAVFDDDDFTIGDELVVHVKAHGIARLLVELDDCTGGKLKHLAHGELAGAELDGDLNFDVKDEIESFIFHGDVGQK